MLRLMRFKGAQVFVWIVLGLLIVGLAGFGIGDVLRGGLASSVAQVGDARIGVQAYAQEVARELRSLSQMQGRPVSMAEAQSIGLPRYVLDRMTRAAAVKAEALRVGLAAGDAAVLEAIAKDPRFAPDGRFNAESFRLFLQNLRMTETEYRDAMREQLVIGLLADALAVGATMPPAHLATILAWRGERRSVRFVRLEAERFGRDAPEPDEAELAAFHAAHAADYTLPETREVAFLLLDPAALADGIEVSEEDLRATWAARADRYRVPERRNLDRLVFATEAEAAAARARIEAGEATLAGLAAERGLGEADIALGDRRAEDLAEPARSAVFGTAEPGLVGPVASGLGPALFRVNAILAAAETPFEAARAEIRAEIARARARERAAALAPKVEDLVAGGARIEEIAAELGLQAGRIEVPATGPAEGLAADARFRAAAFAAKPGTETDLAAASDGRLFVLRVDAVRPAALQPLETVREAVLAAKRAEHRLAVTRAKAEALAASLAEGRDFARAALAMGLTPAEAGPFTRDATVPGLPPALLRDLFAAEPGGTALAEEAGAVILARLESVTPFDPYDPVNGVLFRLYQDQVDQSFAGDLFLYFALAVEQRDGVSIDAAAVEAALARIQQ